MDNFVNNPVRASVYCAAACFTRRLDKQVIYHRYSCKLEHPLVKFRKCVLQTDQLGPPQGDLQEGSVSLDPDWSLGFPVEIAGLRGEAGGRGSNMVWQLSYCHKT